LPKDRRYPPNTIKTIPKRIEKSFMKTHRAPIESLGQASVELKIITFGAHSSANELIIGF
jgi:hypothetical protein